MKVNSQENFFSRLMPVIVIFLAVILFFGALRVASAKERLAEGKNYIILLESSPTQTLNAATLPKLKVF